MYKKISLFLILIILINISSCSYSGENNSKNKEMTEEEIKKNFAKAFTTIVLPFAYAFHWLTMKVFGPAKAGINYDIKLWNNKELKNLKIYLPYVFYKGKPLKDENVFFYDLSKKMETEYMVYEDYYKEKGLLEKVKCERINTKYGPMLMLFIPRLKGRLKGRNWDNYTEIEIGAISDKINKLFPYYLSEDFRLGYEEEVGKWKEQKGERSNQ